MRQPSIEQAAPDPSRYPIGTLQSRAEARKMLEARRKDLSRLSDEKILHSIARLAARIIGGGTVLIRADFLAFGDIEPEFTASEWGHIEAMALRRDWRTYGPGESLEAVEVLPDSIIPVHTPIVQANGSA